MATFQCDDCGSRGSKTWMLDHDCSHAQYVQSNGGRCEDFPCCGHTDGDGCMPQESHTSAFWHDVLARQDFMDDFGDFVDTDQYL